MKRLLNLSILFILVIFPVTIFANSSNINNPNQNVFSGKDIVNLAKPSIVRLGQHVVGQATIANINIDLLTLKLKPVLDSSSTIDIDEYSTGSGFFVNSKGYIATNAHVVSTENVKKRIIENIVKSDFELDSFKYSKGDISTIQKYSSKTIIDFKDKIYNYLIKNSTFNLKNNTVVINPKTTALNLKEAISTGIPVSVVYPNDKSFSDKKDLNSIAIVKMKDGDFPALPILISNDVEIGTKIYSIGFSGDEQGQSSNFLNTAVTSGLIGSKKKVGDSFVWQIDSKIPEGLSGGPVIDSSGNVIGIISFQTVNLNENLNSAFVISSSEINSALKKIGIKKEEGNYSMLFKEALSLKNQRHCKKAIVKFESTKRSVVFVDVNNNIDGYIDSCNDMIKNGQSVDTKFAGFINWIKNIDLIVWIIILISVISSIIFIVVIIFLKKRISVEENELKKLENIVVKDHYKEEFPDSVSQGDSDLPLSSIEKSLIKYIKESKKAFIEDDIIKKELKKSGWNDDEIKKAFDLAK